MSPGMCGGALETIYADYIEWKIFWTNVTLFWVFLSLVIAGSILNSVGPYSADSSGGMSIMSIIVDIALLASYFLKLTQVHKLFWSFGKGVGWFIGYILLNNIMILALGFGSSEYLGPRD